MFLWSVILLASVSIGLFFLFSILTRQKRNPTATYLFAGILIQLTATNLDNWLYASGLWQSIPRLSGFSRGSILLLGPLMFLYLRSILTNVGRLRWTNVMHAIPYLAAMAYFAPVLFFSDTEYKLIFIEYGFEGKPPLDLLSYSIIALYVVHLVTYFALSVRLVHIHPSKIERVSYQIPRELRLSWTRQFLLTFALCILSYLILVIWIALLGVYRIEVNLVMTTVYSLLIFYLSAGIVKADTLVFSDFAKKYKSLRTSEGQEQDYEQRLNKALSLERVYLDPALSLSRLAESTGIPSGQLSRFINEKHAMNFSDFVNSFRIEEIKRRLQDPQYNSLTILGMAFDVGFSSKSSFNAAFKKATGQSPSEFKRT